MLDFLRARAISFLLGGAVFLAAFAILTGGICPRPSSGSTSSATVLPVAENQPPEIEAPDFTLEDMSGKDFKLSDHNDKVVVLNFWATWCPPCRKEIPGFIEVQEEYREKGVLFVGVSLDEEGFEVVRPYAEKMKINYPLVVDNGSVARMYGGIPSLPTTFIIRNGMVVWGTPGMLDEARLRQQLDLALAKK